MLIQHPLRHGETGPNVSRLHAALRRLGYEVFSDELNAARFGDRTLKAVLAFQQSQNLDATGIVDETTARALQDQFYTVRGRVTGSDGRPLTGIPVQAKDRDPGHFQVFEDKPKTEADGSYVLTYTAREFARAEKKAADLVVFIDWKDQASNPLQAESPLIQQAKREEVVDLVVEDGSTLPASAYDKLIADVAPLLSFIDGNTVEEQLTRLSNPQGDFDPKTNDVVLIASELDRPTDEIRALVTAAGLAAKGPGVADTRYLYALWSQGVALTHDALGDLTEVELVQHLKAALAADIIVIPDEQDWQRAIERLLKFFASLESEGIRDHRKPGRAQLWAAGLPDNLLKTMLEFERSGKGGERGSEGYWQALTQHQGFNLSENLAAAKMVYDLGVLSAEHPPFVAAVMHMRQRGQVRDLRDLAHLDKQTIKHVLTNASPIDAKPVSAPDVFDQDDEEARIDAYATHLSFMVAARYPNAAFAARLGDSGNSEAKALAGILAGLDETSFNVYSGNAAAFVKATPDAVPAGMEAKAFTSLLRKGHSALRLAGGDPEVARRLFDAGYTDVKRVATAGENVFRTQMGTFIGSDAVEKVLDHVSRAKRVGPYAGLLMASHETEFTGRGVPRSDTPSNEEFDLGEGRDWRTLFGSEAYCPCEHCNSVFSPAAYLTDLLYFLSQLPSRLKDGVILQPPLDPGVEPDSVLAIFKKRRGDICELDLNCDNTNTELPYIDLVNEVLEDAVLQTPPSDPRNTEMTAAELRLRPEHVRAEAYVPINDAVFPWSLPFDPLLLEAQRYLSLLRTNLGELLNTFQPLAGDGLQAHDTARARYDLNLLPAAWEAIVDSGAENPWMYWGFAGEATGPGTTWLDTLARVSELMKRSELSYEDVVATLKTNLVAHTAWKNNVSLVPIDGNDDEFTCDPEKLKLAANLSSQQAHDFHRFSRLRRALGWSVDELDLALRAVGAERREGETGDIGLTPDHLLQLAALVRIQTRLGLPVIAVASWWSGLQTWTLDPESRPLYPRMFLDAAGQPRDSEQDAFKLAGDALALATSNENLDDHIARVAAGLHISPQDVAALIESTESEGERQKLNLENLSRLFHVASLAKALEVRPPELLKFTQLIETQPFGRPTVTETQPSSQPTETEELIKHFEEFKRHELSVETLEELLTRKAPTDTKRQRLEQIVTSLTRKLNEQSATAGLATEEPTEPEETSGEGSEGAIAEQRDNLILSELTTAFALPSNVVETLLGHMITVPAATTGGDAPLHGIDALRALADAEVVSTPLPDPEGGEPPVPRSPSDPESPLYAAYRTLARVDAIAQLLNTNPIGRPAHLVGALQRAGENADFLLAVEDPTSATTPERYDSLRHILSDTRFAASLELDDDGLERLRVATSETDPNFSAELLALSEWSEDSLTPVTASDGLNVTNIQSAPYALERIGQAMTLLAAKELPASEALAWLTLTGRHSLPDSDNRNPADLADAVRQAARARVGEAAWRAAATPIEDELRDVRRDALLAFLSSGRYDDDGNLRTSGRSAEELFEELLIDPQMGACMMTSRIKQAISAVQLFVQRCLLGLETDVVTGDNPEEWQEWQWRRQYRVWEAARKVNLYAENYLFIGPRDDQTVFFKEFIKDLQQGELTDDAATEALGAYLQKLGEVARLQIIAIHEEDDPDLDDNPVIHVFGKTHGQAPRFFYCKRHPDGRWSGWEPVPLDIESGQIVASVWQGKLYLFWLIFREKQEQDERGIEMPIAGERLDPGRRYLEIQLAWSRRLGEGQWAPKESSTAAIRSTDFVPAYLAGVDKKPNYSIGVSLSGSGLRIDVRVVGYPVGIFHFIGDFGQTRAEVEIYFDGISHSSGEIIDNHIRLHKPWGQTSNPFWIYHQTNDQIRFDQPHWDTYIQRPEHFRMLFEDAKASAGTFRVLLSADRNYSVVWDWDPVYFKATHSSYSLTDDDSDRCFLVEPFVPPFEQRLYRALGGAGQYTGPRLSSSGRRGSAIALRYIDLWQFYFRPFYHHFADGLTAQLSMGGIGALLDRSVQKNPADELPSTRPVLDFESMYEPTELVAFAAPGEAEGEEHYAREDLTFELEDPYSVYNWEIFLWAPLFISRSLAQAQRFEDALKRLAHIIDFTDATVRVDEDETTKAPAKYWQTRPLHEFSGQDRENQRLPTLLRRLYAGDEKLQRQFEAWERDPFNPFVIARSRWVVIQKAVIFTWADIVIQWADYNFRRYTHESLMEALQLYIMAAEVMGPRQKGIDRDNVREIKTFKQLQELGLGPFANAPAEGHAGVAASSRPGHDSTSALSLPPLLYFCAPPNDKLAEYWDLLDDRLNKIRNCLNIEGRRQPLPLFQPPIDPALLVRARAAGLSVSEAVASLAVATPHYRFEVMAARALELCPTVISLGANLLSALEKKDAEALSRLRARHEVELHEMIGDIRQAQHDSEVEGLAGLEQSKTNLATQLGVYDDWLGVSGEDEEPNLDKPTLLDAEQESSTATKVAYAGQQIAAIHQMHTIPLPLLPEFKIGAPTSIGATFGGSNISAVANAITQMISTTASLSSQFGGIRSTMAQHQRRAREHDLRRKQLKGELAQIEHQIEAAKHRRAIAEHELKNHARRLEKLKEQENFLLLKKYTNEELYDHLAGELSTLYFQAYQLAVDLAKRAESAYHYEMNNSTAFIGAAYWDSQRKGLLAGEKLQYDIKRMQIAYHDGMTRHDELTKSVSLAMWFPHQLAMLRATGRCEISLSEALFDLDVPGQFMRRLKSVALTIPCVIGPYASVNCRLTLTESEIRRSSRTESSSPFERIDNTPVTSMITSHAREDTGLFETNLRDERYLPFEGAGAISEWELQLPHAGEDGLRQFDYDTISDVILHLRYTAKDGGELAAREAKERLRNELKTSTTFPPAGGGGESVDIQAFPRHFSLRHEFPNAWHSWLSAPDETDSPLAIDLKPEHLPFFSGSLSGPINFKAFSLYVTYKDDNETVDVVPEIKVIREDGRSPTLTSFGDAAVWGNRVSTFSAAVRNVEEEVEGERLTNRDLLLVDHDRQSVVIALDLGPDVTTQAARRRIRDVGVLVWYGS